MKLFRTPLMLAVATLLCSVVMVFAAFGGSHTGAEGFSVKEYEDFHHVLHPLQHEALPNKDFSRIRSKAEELVKLGEGIVKLGVPQGTAPANVEEFKKELKNFNEKLAKFSADAKSGTDDELKVSYTSVHDSFEMLAGMLPRESMK